MAGGGKRDREGVERRGADVAVHDTQRGEREEPRVVSTVQILGVIVREETAAGAAEASTRVAMRASRSNVTSPGRRHSRSGP